MRLLALCARAVPGFARGLDMLQDREALMMTTRAELAVQPSRRARPAAAATSPQPLRPIHFAAQDALTIWPTRRLRAGLLAWPDSVRLVRLFAR